MTSGTTPRIGVRSDSGLRVRSGRILSRAIKPVRERVHWVMLHGLVRSGINKGVRSGDAHARFMMATRPGGNLSASVEELRQASRPSGLTTGLMGHATADHALCREVLASPDFSSGIVIGNSELLRRLIDATHGPHLDPLRAPSLLMIEAPDHTRIRKLTTRYFTGRAVATLQKRTREIAESLLDDLEREVLAGASEVDVVARYCSALPVAVICEILGVPTTHSARVLALGTQVAASLDLGASWADAQHVVRGLEDFKVWIDEHLDWLRQNPGDNLLSQLIRARDEDGELSADELAIAAGLILAAGFETTVNLLGNGISLLCQHPDQLRVLQAQPDLWGNACEEVLRFDPPVLMSGRHAVRATTLAGVDLPAMAMVSVVLYGANRDPAVFERADQFEVARSNAAQHLSFSAGRHHCLGAALARMEGAVGLQLFFERFPTACLAPGATRRRTRILRGWESLPLRLTS